MFIFPAYSNVAPSPYSLFYSLSSFNPPSVLQDVNQSHP